MSEVLAFKVGLHQGSVLSLLVVMDTVHGEVMDVLLFKILFAVNLVLMVDSREE